MENEKLRVSHSVAVKLRHQLGCEIVRKKDKATGKEFWNVSDKKTRDSGRRTAYVPEDYTNHRAALNAMVKEQDGQWEEGLASAVTLVVKAARKARRLPAAAFVLEQALSSMINSFDLESHITGIFRDEHGLEGGQAQAAQRRLALAPAGTGLEVSRGALHFDSGEESDAPARPAGKRSDPKKKKAKKRAPKKTAKKKAPKKRTSRR